MTYPVQGGTWDLDADACEELQRIYRRLDVAGELEKARLWLLANPRKQKTVRGMPRFVVNWLNRAGQLQTVRPRSKSASLDAAPPGYDAHTWWRSYCLHEPKCSSQAQCVARAAAVTG